VGDELRKADMDEWMFDYYLFINRFSREPVDMQDLMDGMVAVQILLNLEVKTKGLV
jgi:hypothetical protein